MNQGTKHVTPTLEGVRIRLEPLTLAHLPALERVALDPSIWRFMNTPVFTPAALEIWVEAALALEAAGSGMPWAITLKSQATGEQDRVLGSTRFMDMDLRHRTVEIGNTWIVPEFHGAGVNAEAKLLQLTYAFETLGLRRVALKTHHENLQSQAAMRKLGARYEGIFRNHYIMDNGGPAPQRVVLHHAGRLATGVGRPFRSRSCSHGFLACGLNPGASQRAGK